MAIGYNIPTLDTDAMVTLRTALDNELTRVTANEESCWQYKETQQHAPIWAEKAQALRHLIGIVAEVRLEHIG